MRTQHSYLHNEIKSCYILPELSAVASFSEICCHRRSMPFIAIVTIAVAAATVTAADATTTYYCREIGVSFGPNI